MGHRSIRDELGGSLRAGDPRRFLVEVMVGAMQADGEIDEREEYTLRRMLASHALFDALPDRAATALIEISTDTIAYAGGADHRVVAVAERLLTRTHRLAAYAMACEVITADDEVAASEARYLARLRFAMMIGDRDHRELLAAAQRHRALVALEQATARARELLWVVAHGAVLRRQAAGGFTSGDTDGLCAALGRLGDFPATAEEREKHVVRAAGALVGADAPSAELERLAAAVTDPADRYWLMVYLLALDAARGGGGWHEIELYLVAKQVFGLRSDEMTAAEQHAWRLAGLR